MWTNYQNSGETQLLFYQVICLHGSHPLESAVTVTADSATAVVKALLHSKGMRQVSVLLAEEEQDSYDTSFEHLVMHALSPVYYIAAVFPQSQHNIQVIAHWWHMQSFF